MSPPPDPTPEPSTKLARAAVLSLLAQGVTDVVLSPGSRNAPLSFAVHEVAAAGLLRLHTRIDERSAGFLALGLSRVDSPAAVVCTSGTAVANLHPAVLEAAHSGVPLVVVTADRPSRLHGTGANQTTDQVGIFGPLVMTLDLEAQPGTGQWAMWVGDGPVHLNVRFDEPLVPAEPWTTLAHDLADALGGEDEHEDESQANEHGILPRRSPDLDPRPVPSAQELVATARARRSAGGWGRSVRGPAAPETLPLGPRTVVVAGDDAGPPARQLAERAGWPLLAEPSSGARTGENAIRAYRLLLGTDLGERIERVVVCGHPTLSRPVTRLLTRPGVEVVSGPVRGVWSERPFPVASSHPVVPTVAGSDDPAWLDAWRDADRSVSRQVDRLLAAEPDLTPYEVAGAVSRALPPGGLLHVGASSPIRDLDLMVARYAVGDRRKVVANRGLAGIDGVVSSAIGAALGRPHGTRNLALMGDVTFLHDANGLVLGPREARPDLTIVVVNDDGGSIFTMLEQGAEEHASGFDTLFGTPHGVDLAALCAATRTPHWRVGSLPELEQALASPNGGIEVIEVPVRRDNRRDLDLRLRALRP
ncbi:2-succinyl-5-enolpyruvyl-6-hydroxy-3-cyclohexene-1-carboxylate synthase [Nocardioides ferulae]|uniref:2-succinyl-5-enolpyruvyl-6-hydroxy-3- cyclohexene-1-carboxylate synthase n=1 Tax=Nocardioides ferulae TaxID=2340821 RepID=UPI000EB11212|nr:thiamine pyrophosphate-binding protein [Nocardioides ferulae]